MLNTVHDGISLLFRELNLSDRTGNANDYNIKYAAALMLQPEYILYIIYSIVMLVNRTHELALPKSE